MKEQMEMQWRLGLGFIRIRGLDFKVYLLVVRGGPKPLNPKPCRMQSSIPHEELASWSGLEEVEDVGLRRVCRVFGSCFKIQEPLT